MLRSLALQRVSIEGGALSRLFYPAGPLLKPPSAELGELNEGHILSLCVPSVRCCQASNDLGAS